MFWALQLFALLPGVTSVIERSLEGHDEAAAVSGLELIDDLVSRGNPSQASLSHSFWQTKSYSAVSTTGSSWGGSCCCLQLCNEEVLNDGELLQVLNFLLRIASATSVDIGIRQQAMAPIHWAARQKPRGWEMALSLVTAAYVATSHSRGLVFWQQQQCVRLCKVGCFSFVQGRIRAAALGRFGGNGCRTR